MVNYLDLIKIQKYHFHSSFRPSDLHYVYNEVVNIDEKLDEKIFEIFIDNSQN